MTAVGHLNFAIKRPEMVFFANFFVFFEIYLYFCVLLSNKCVYANKMSFFGAYS